MIELNSSTYIDTRTGNKMFQLTLKKDGIVSSSVTEYQKIMTKSSAEQEMCEMIKYLCDIVYTVQKV